MTTTALRVSALYVYPVKSCRGIAVDMATVTELGLQWDRHWLVVAAEDHKFLTQRTIPKMVLITPRLAVRDGVPGIWLSAPGKDEEIWLPSKLPDAEVEQAMREVTVWKDTIQAVDLGDEAAEWLSSFLDKPVRVVAKAGAPRIVDRYLPKDVEERKLSPQTAFADGFPFLMASEASLADLNSRLERAVDMRHFRPNIVVAGNETPFAEDTWAHLRITSTMTAASSPPLELHVACRCTRCTMPNVDPDRGESMGLQPLKTLQSYRRVDPGAKYQACFGVNLIPLTFGKCNELRVGDRIEVLATGELSR